MIALKTFSHSMSMLRFETNESNIHSHEAIFTTDSSTIGMLLDKDKFCTKVAICWYVEPRASSNPALSSAQYLSQNLFPPDESIGAFDAVANSSSINFAWQLNVVKMHVSHLND